jgi:sortase (surface protein transpeptidase)
MFASLNNPEFRKTLASLGAVLLFSGICLLFVTHQIGVDIYSYLAAPESGVATSSEPLAAPLSGSDPVRLRIPKIYVEAPFVRLGLQENGQIEVPKGFQEVGWYTNGPTPGELGPAVVLGHIDSYQGPGVFLYLGQLHEGDLVYVDRADGTTATFRVDALERYDRDAFPTEKVYGNIDHAGLRLITCSGTYSHETNRYSRVLVVYASLVDNKNPQ